MSFGSPVPDVPFVRSSNVKALSSIWKPGVAARIACRIAWSRGIAWPEESFTVLPVTAKRVAWLTPFCIARKVYRMPAKSRTAKLIVTRGNMMMPTSTSALPRSDRRVFLAIDRDISKPCAAQARLSARAAWAACGGGRPVAPEASAGAHAASIGKVCFSKRKSRLPQILSSGTSLRASSLSFANASGRIAGLSA